MKTIWKFTLELTYHQNVKIPVGFKVRHVGPPSNTASSAMGVCVWVEVIDDAPKTTVDFYIIGTGHPLPPDHTIYCGTAVMADQYVWHVYRGASA